MAEAGLGLVHGPLQAHAEAGRRAGRGPGPGGSCRPAGGRRARRRCASRGSGRCRRRRRGDAVDRDARGAGRAAAGGRDPDGAALREGEAGWPKVPSALKPTKEFERKARTEKKARGGAQYDYRRPDLHAVRHRQQPTNKFCKRCGSSLAEAQTAVQPSWFKRLLTKLHLRRRKQFEAGYRKRQKEGKKSIFWRLQSLSFRSFGLFFMRV